MNLDRSLIFAYLEEDNIQRAYFRVRPLLTLEGDIQQEAMQLWPNEGGLRIVPDRNEQHTFKVRMRKLGSYCVVDLRNQPAEAGKIRTNKNFKPDRGEVNQYILYSDTVHEVPEHTFYQLVDGKPEDYADFSRNVITPRFYIRDDDTLYGPVHKNATAQPTPAEETRAVMFEVACPDGLTRSILCIEDERHAATPVAASAQTPVKEEPAEDTAGIAEPVVAEEAVHTSEAPVKAGPAEQPAELPIGQPLQILDQPQDHEETLRQLDKPVSEGANLLRQDSADSLSSLSAPAKNEPLTGTPLVRTPLHVAAQQQKNHTQEIVSNQWSVGKYEPPAENLPAGMSMRAVDNPVQNACNALRSAWNIEDAHDQLLEYILTLDGLRPLLETKLCNGQSVTVMQHILQERLKDLEAERLTALCELDRARRDVDAYKQELISAISSRLNHETNQLEASRDRARTQLNTIKAEVNALTLQRDALLSKVNDLQRNTLPESFARIAAEVQMTMPISGTPLRMSPVAGQHTEAEELISRLQKVFADSAYPIDRNTAVALLVLLAICPRLGISSPSTAALSTLANNVSAGLGWQSSFAQQYAAEQYPMIGARPVDATPAIITTNLPNYAPVAGATKLTLSRSQQNLTRNAAYDVSQWPIFVLPALPFIPAFDVKNAAPVSQVSLTEFAAKEVVSAAELDAILAPLLNAALPLSGYARKEMYRFVSICAGLMEGGLPVAADWGIMLWVIPNVERGSRQYPAVKALLDEFPLSLSKL